MVSAVTLTGATQNAQKTETQGLGLAEDFSQFLTLLTTQLQNQDPLDPMDSAEFTNQLVQFSQVEQSINTNQKLDDLVSLQLGSIASVALGYVGMDVSYLGAEMNFDGESPIKIDYGFGEDAVDATVNIYNEEGELVFTDDAPKSIGANQYVWDGAHKGGGFVDDGTYTVRIDALSAAGEQIETSTAISGRVRGIESQNGVIYLLVGDRAVTIGNIINATNPETSGADTPPETETEEAA